MASRWTRLATVGAALLAVSTGCDGKSGTEAVLPPAHSRTVDACALLAKADLEAILGAPARAESRSAGAVSTCLFAGAKGSVTVQVATTASLSAVKRSMTAARWADEYERGVGSLGTSAPTVETVPGLGDRARVLTLPGVILAHLVVLRGDGAVVAVFRVGELELARALLAKVLAAL